MNVRAHERDLIVSALTEGIWHISIERQHKRNAITLPMFESLAESLRHADGREDVRCILVTGAGDNFCSGHDLESFQGWPQQPHDPVPLFLHTIADVRKPVVIAAQGSAVGIAVTWLLHAAGW